MMTSKPCSPGAPASVADWEAALAAAIAASTARAEHWNDHPGDLDDTNLSGLFVDPDQPDPVLDAAYRSGIVTPERRVQTTVADVQIAITSFPDRHALRKTERVVPLGCLADDIRNTRASQKQDLQLLKLAQFGDARSGKGCIRFDANVVGISGVEADYDGEQVSVGEAIEIAVKAGLLCIIYTSPSHTPEKPRWRILCPTSHEFPSDHRELFLARTNGLYGGIFARESWTLSQSYYFGCVRNETHRVELIDGQSIDLLDSLDGIAIGNPRSGKRTSVEPTRPEIGLSRYAEVSLDNAERAIRGAPFGEQEITLVRKCFGIGTLAGAGGIPADFALQVLHDIAARLPDLDPRRPWSARELRRKVERAFAAGLAKPREARHA